MAYLTSTDPKFLRIPPGMTSMSALDGVSQTGVKIKRRQCLAKAVGMNGSASIPSASG